jgi:hypothetical protein
MIVLLINIRRKFIVSCKESDILITNANGILSVTTSSS